jgi:pyruvate formate lyase activating enzyme
MLRKMLGEYMKTEDKTIKGPVVGRIHSIESFGAVDGPGIRYVLFVQGCPLKCLFCHNPDSWCEYEGTLTDSEKIANDIATYKNYIKNGGVTISGGEPLFQPAFVVDILKRCKSMGLHTAVDTSGGVGLVLAKPVIDAADMLLLDIKALDPVLCKELTGKSNENALEILDYCEKIGKPIWIRHVMVPGYTLEKKSLEDLADYLTAFTCIKKIELLPFHKMGEYKWEQLGKEYSLTNTPEPTREEIKMANEIFRQRKLPI